jgi:phytoene synthase
VGTGPLSLTDSYAWCEAVARQQAGNFYHAFRFLPRPQRLGMCALYAFSRVADDISDGPESVEEKRGPLAEWGRSLQAARQGDYSHPLHPAIHDTIRRYSIPPEYLLALIEGVCMDLQPVHYVTFAELKRYCYHVASVVGLACIHIWGFADERAKAYAEDAGVALQLTNILRDLREDAERGRVYLPAEELRRFGYSPEELNRGERNEAFRELMGFQVERARSFYQAARPLAGLLQPAGRAVFQVMTGTYRGLLEAIVRRDYDVFSSRVRLSKWHKLWLVVKALPVRYGWG